MLLGFIRITTKRAVLESPWPAEEALERVEAWLAQPNVRIVRPTRRHAEWLAGFVSLWKTPTITSTQGWANRKSAELMLRRLARSACRGALENPFRLVLLWRQ